GELPPDLAVSRGRRGPAGSDDLRCDRQLGFTAWPIAPAARPAAMLAARGRAGTGAATDPAGVAPAGLRPSAGAVAVGVRRAGTGVPPAPDPLPRVSRRSSGSHHGARLPPRRTAHHPVRIMQGPLLAAGPVALARVGR